MKRIEELHCQGNVLGESGRQGAGDVGSFQILMKLERSIRPRLINFFLSICLTLPSICRFTESEACVVRVVNKPVLERR